MFRASGPGLIGNGCVGHVASPGTVLWGTGRSSSPKTGSPVTRLKTNKRPIFVMTATAGIVAPFRLTSISVGAAGRGVVPVGAGAQIDVQRQQRLWRSILLTWSIGEGDEGNRHDDDYEPGERH